LLKAHGAEIAVIMPYATFGYNIDLGHYEALSQRYGVPVVVDAAASLGTLNADGEGFGAGSNIPIIFSMHATKSFAAGEGGVIYSADKAFIDTIKIMSNFGFGRPREATMPGLNAKLSEVGALSALLRLQEFETLVERRQMLVDLYRNALPDFTFQPSRGTRQAHQFVSALLPARFVDQRDALRDGLGREGIGMGAYFSPHLAQQAYFQNNCAFGNLPVTDNVAARIISLPLYDTMTAHEVLSVIASLQRQLGLAHHRMSSMPDDVDYQDNLAAD